MFSTEDLKTAIGATVIARRNAAARLREAGNPRDPFRALPGMEQQFFEAAQSVRSYDLVLNLLEREVKREARKRAGRTAQSAAAFLITAGLIILATLGFAAALLKIRNLLPFSDAKEGPLSTLTLSGQRTMTTYAHGLTLAGDAPAEAMNKSLQQVQGALDRKPEKKVDLGGGKKDKDESSDEGSSGKGKQVIIHKLLVPVDLKKIKDLQQLLALLQEVEDYAAANEDGEPGDDEDAAPAPA